MDISRHRSARWTQWGLQVIDILPVAFGAYFGLGVWPDRSPLLFAGCQRAGVVANNYWCFGNDFSQQHWCQPQVRSNFSYDLILTRNLRDPISICSMVFMLYINKTGCTSSMTRPVNRVYSMYQSSHPINVFVMIQPNVFRIKVSINHCFGIENRNWPETTVRMSCPAILDCDMYMWLPVTECCCLFPVVFRVLPIAYCFQKKTIYYLGYSDLKNVWRILSQPLVMVFKISHFEVLGAPRHPHVAHASSKSTGRHAWLLRISHDNLPCERS